MFLKLFQVSPQLFDLGTLDAHSTNKADMVTSIKLVEKEIGSHKQASHMQNTYDMLN